MMQSSFLSPMVLHVYSTPLLAKTPAGVCSLVTAVLSQVAASQKSRNDFLLYVLIFNERITAQNDLRDKFQSLFSVH